MNDGFAVLPTPIAYQLVTIDDDDGEPIIERRISNPETVIGFVIEKHSSYFSVSPVTHSGVHDGCPEYALIRPDGKVEASEQRGRLLFDSFEDWKQFMRYEAAACYEEAAADAKKDGDKKDATTFLRCARAHRKEIEEHE